MDKVGNPHDISSILIFSHFPWAERPQLHRDCHLWDVEVEEGGRSNAQTPACGSSPPNAANGPSQNHNVNILYNQCDRKFRNLLKTRYQFSVFHYHASSLSCAKNGSLSSESARRFHTQRSSEWYSIVLHRQRRVYDMITREHARHSSSYKARSLISSTTAQRPKLFVPWPNHCYTRAT